MTDEEENDDKRLVDATLAGDMQSFEALVRKYQDRLYNTMVQVTGSTHEAEEVVQDAMLQAYTKLDTFRGKSSFYTWLYRIAFNQSISRTRRKRPRVSLDQIRQDAGVDPIDSVDSPEAHIERTERVEHVHRALNQLSEEFRMILVLRELEDCDYDTIAQVLEIPVGTVRSRLHRGRTMLRDHLRESMGELGNTQ